MREVEILKKKQLKCYLYTRVSTSMQVDGYSLDAQRDKLRKYAAYEDMIVAGEYSDEGFSGKNIQGRQEFQRMLNDIQDGKDDVSYVLVFKLSRFGRNAADVLNSLQLMQDFGVNLICVEDGIDSSKDAGKLMISVLSAVAEIERENIRTQTMAGREQKAREGKWNGGFAPYGYKLENGNLVIAEDEVEVIRVIYDRYIHTNEGVAGVAKYLNRNGYTKKLRQNNTIPGFSRDFVKNVLYNPVYMGKIAYGRRRTEKKQGTRNEMHVVEQSEFPVYEGQHEAIISEEDWYLAQEKRKINSFKREKVNNPDHAHILSGILKCPCCGKSMYGNIAKAHSKDKKTRYYYYCKNTVTPTGHECSFRLNIEQTEINKFVAKVISAMVNNPRFVEAIQAKIGTAVDTEDMERQIAVLQGRLKQAFGTKSRLERQMDTLDINDAHYDRKILDLQRRYDEQYDTIEDIEVQIGELQSQIRSIQQEKISGNNIYRLLLAFDEVYHSATEAEQKEFMKAFIERIEMFPEKRKDGSWIKKIVFNFPVPVDGEEVKELPLETETTVERMPLLKVYKDVYKDKFATIYDDMGRIYSLMQRQDSLIEKENIVSSISRSVVESLFNRFFRGIEKETLEYISNKAKSDLDDYGCKNFAQQLTQYTELDASSISLSHHKYASLVIGRIRTTKGNSIVEKFINVMILNYYLGTAETKRFLSKSTAQRMYHLTDKLNRIRRKVSHDTDERFEPRDYDFYMANVFELINGLLEAYKED